MSEENLLRALDGSARREGLNARLTRAKPAAQPAAEPAEPAERPAAGRKKGLAA